MTPIPARPAVLPVPVSGLSPLKPVGIREDFVLPGPDGRDRFVRVHLPPDYRQKPQFRYPLLLLQDGQNLFEDETAFQGQSWRLGAALMDGRQSGVLRDVIAVGIDNANSFEGRAWEYAPWPSQIERDGKPQTLGGGAQAYLDWMERTVLPELEKRYRLEEGSQNRVLGGASLGALLSLYAFVQKPGLFGGALLMSGSWWWEGFQDWLKASGLPQAGVRLYVDVGEQEENLKSTIPLIEILGGLGFVQGQNLKFYRDPDGEHNESSWRRRVQDLEKGPLGYFFGAHPGRS